MKKKNINRSTYTNKLHQTGCGYNLPIFASKINEY